MTKRRLQESEDGLCPYCGSDKNLSGGATIYGLRRFYCECGGSFTFGKFKNTVQEITISVFKNRFRFPKKTMEYLGFNANDAVRFTEEGGDIVIKKVPSSVLILNDADKNGSEFHDYLSAENFRFIFDKLNPDRPESFSLFIQKNKIMGLISKQKIKSKITVEKEGIQRVCFFGIRRTGSAYISARLREVMSLEAGDEIFIYEKNGKVFLTVDMEEEHKGEGFKVSRMGAEGFQDSLTIGSTLFALFFISKFSIEKGQSIRILVSEKRSEIDGKTMFEVFNP